MICLICKTASGIHCAGLLGGKLHWLCWNLLCVSEKEAQLWVQPLGLSCGQQQVLNTDITAPGAHGDGEASQLKERSQENEVLDFFGKEDSLSFCNKIPRIQNYQGTGYSVICHLVSSI